ncbi:MAG: ATP-NAD kinase family protein [Halobacteriota archaeon]
MALPDGSRRIGFLLNPIAGMGGRVGLKGTDDKVDLARELGAEPRAPRRGRRALEALRAVDPDVALLTPGEPMGAAEARMAGFDPVVVHRPAEPTTAADTRSAVVALCDRGVDLVLFVGGDGTAADVAEAIAEGVPMLGVPAGVKMFSSVFAATPADAGRLAATFEDVEGREVMDIDESAYREGRVAAELLAVVDVPIGTAIQGGKQLASGDVTGLAEGFADDVDPEVTYVLGAGSTVGEIKRALGFEGSPLGIDVWRDGEVLALDANETTLLELVEPPAVAVVSPIGGQGFILGRGTQQLSPRVLRRCDLEVVATKTKLDAIDVLRVDTDDPELDEALRGWIKVRVDRHERRMMKVV